MEIKRINASDTWLIRQAVMWADKPLDYVKLANDEKGMHFGLFIKDKLISIVSLFIDSQEAQFRKFATLEEEQGKGYGSKLLSYLFDQLIELNVKKVWCNARVEKTAFYKRFGMIKTEQIFSKGGIDYVIMEKNIL